MRTTTLERSKDYTKRGWWENYTLQELFSDVIRESDNRLALVDPSNRGAFVEGQPLRMTFGEIEAAVDKVGSWLFDEGLRQGDIVLVQMPNTVEIVVMYLAAARLGLIISPVAMQYGQFELSHIAKAIKPAAYISFRRFKGKPFAESQVEALGEACRQLFFGADGFSLKMKMNPSDGYVKYYQGLQHDPNDVFTICWTSGTTGRSKGVPRSHNQWLATALAMKDATRLPQYSIFLNPFPFINMAAIGGFLYFWLKNCGTMILHHPFDSQVYLKQIQDENVAYTLAPPALLNRLIQAKDQIKTAFDLSSLKVIGSGSAPLSAHMIEGFKTHFEIEVTNVFGSNEGATLLSGASDVPDPVERAVYFPRFGRIEHVWENRISTKLRTKLIGLDTGKEVLEPGVVGEMCIKGATVFDGYFESPEDNEEVFTQDGYFRTGDLFQIAGGCNQFYQFVGRCKALIVRGGVNISPEELDELLNAHPFVLEGAVVSYPDKIMGEKICAVVVLKDGHKLTLEDLTFYMSEKRVAKFKWPESLHVIDALPRNAMNKVIRHELEALIPF